VYDIDEQIYVQKTEAEEEEKYSRLQGLSERIEELDGVEGRICARIYRILRHDWTRHCRRDKESS